jgi:ribosomal-protein-alanine N-acetyltransferase
LSAQLQFDLRLLPMHVSHLQQVLEIEQRAYEFPWSEGIFKDCLKAGYSSWIVTNLRQELVGYAVMSMAVGEAHVLNLCVDPRLHRQGLGRYLLQYLVTLARAAHSTIVLLEVRKSNKPAIRLYEQQGFTRLGLRKAYYPAVDGREDAIVLGYEIV